MRTPLRRALALTFCFLSPTVARGADELAVRFAVVVGARHGATETGSGELADRLQGDYLTSWDPESDNPEIRKLFALRGLKEVTRQAARIPAVGSRVGGVARIDGRLWRVELGVAMNQESARIDAEISRDGEVVSAPTIITALGQRAIVSVADDERDMLLFVVVQVDAVAGKGATPDSDPRLLHRVNPDYPASEKAGRREGVVVVALRIDESGAVADARVEKSLAPPFDEAAVAAVRQWRFEPARRAGKPVAVDFRITIRFVPAEEPTD